MEINFLAIGAAGVASWVIGALWYSPVLFGKKWQSLVGMSDEDVQGGNMAVIFGLSLVMMLIMAFGLSPIIQAHGDSITPMHGAFHGAMVGLLFAATSMGINYLYQRKSITLWFIDAGYQVLFLAVSGLILALFA